MDQLQLPVQIPDQDFNFKNGCENAVHFLCYGVKLPNLKLKTWPKKLLGSLPLDIVFPGFLTNPETTNLQKKLFFFHHSSFGHNKLDCLPATN
jgi:hypothetical protein